jgi:hypothetical protein
MNNTNLYDYIILEKNNYGKVVKANLLDYIMEKHKNTDNISNTNFINILKLLYRINQYLWSIYNTKNWKSIPPVNDNSIIENVPGCTSHNLDILKKLIKIINVRHKSFSMYTLKRLVEEHGLENVSINIEIYKNMKFNRLLSFIRENPDALYLFGWLELNDEQIYNIIKLFS